MKKLGGDSVLVWSCLWWIADSTVLIDDEMLWQMLLLIAFRVGLPPEQSSNIAAARIEAHASRFLSR
jgi:hypothetical protein